MKAVLFDVDDTLYSQIVPFENAFKAVLETNQNISMEKLFVSSRKHSDVVFEKSQRGEISMEEMYIYRIRHALLDFGISISDKKALDFQNYYANEQGKISVSDEMKQILDFLKPQELKLGIITNGPSRHQWKKINTLKLQNWFCKENIFVSGDYGFSKPSSEIFQLAEKNMSLSKKDTWFVGDSFNNDVIGAKNAGWNSIWLNKRGRKIFDEIYKPDFILSGENELLNALLVIVKND